MVDVKVTEAPEADGFCEEATTVVVGPRLITSSSACDVTGALALSPLYAAVMAYVPTARLFLESLATPPLTVTVARAVVPLINVTVPVGGGPPEVRVAVKSTFCAQMAGFASDVNEIATVFRLTICIRALDVPGGKSAS